MAASLLGPGPLQTVLVIIILIASLTIIQFVFPYRYPMESYAEAVVLISLIFTFAATSSGAGFPMTTVAQTVATSVVVSWNLLLLIGIHLLLLFPIITKYWPRKDLSLIQPVDESQSESQDN